MKHYYENGFRFYSESDDHFKAGDFFIGVTSALSIIKTQEDVNYLLSTTRPKMELVLNETAEIGNEIHEDIQNYLMQKKFEPRRIQCLENFIKLHGDANGISIENAVASKKYGYAGSYDAIVDLENPTVIEIKTGQFKITAGWQASAYAKALEEIGYVKQPMGVVGYHIHRNGVDAKRFIYEHVDECFLAFLSVLNAFRMLNFNKLKKMNWKHLLVNPVEEYFKSKLTEVKK